MRDNDVNAALRVLKKKMEREGTLRDIKRRRAYEKPSERRVWQKAEAVEPRCMMLRKRLERQGYTVFGISGAMVSEAFLVRHIRATHGGI